MKCILAMLASLAMTTAATAAEVSLEVRKNGEETYIYYSGTTDAEDLDRLKQTYQQAKDMTVSHPSGLPFSGAIVMNGPGGNADTAVEVASWIDEMGFRTIANHECISACSLMWMAGGEEGRYLLGPEAKVMYHFAYSQDAEWFNNYKEQVGWIGIQDHISKSSHYYTAHLLAYGAKDPALFVWALSYYGGANTFYEVTAENINEYVGGKVWDPDVD